MKNKATQGINDIDLMFMIDDFIKFAIKNGNDGTLVKGLQTRGLEIINDENKPLKMSGSRQLTQPSHFTLPAIDINKSNGANDFYEFLMCVEIVQQSLTNIEAIERYGVKNVMKEGKRGRMRSTFNDMGPNHLLQKIISLYHSYNKQKDGSKLNPMEKTAGEFVASFTLIYMGYLHRPAYREFMLQFDSFNDMAIHDLGSHMYNVTDEVISKRESGELKYNRGDRSVTHFGRDLFGCGGPVYLNNLNEALFGSDQVKIKNDSYFDHPDIDTTEELELEVNPDNKNDKSDDEVKHPLKKDIEIVMLQRDFFSRLSKQVNNRDIGNAVLYKVRTAYNKEKEAEAEQEANKKCNK